MMPRPLKTLNIISDFVFTNNHMYIADWLALLELLNYVDLVLCIIKSH